MILFAITAGAHVITFLSGFPSGFPSFDFVLSFVVATVLAGFSMFGAMAVDFLRGAAAWSRMNDMEKQRAIQLRNN